MSETSITLNELLKRLVRHGQCFLVYPAAFEPKPRNIRNPSEHRLPSISVEVRTSDNVLLRCYLIEHPTPKAIALMFHGNGMNHGDLLYHAERFYGFQCSVLTVSYRGYGESEGLPTEKGLQKDAQGALDYILNDPGLSKLPIVIYGISLGGAVAIDVTSRNPDKITALILENTFTSLPNVVRAWPVIGSFAFICTQKWNSASKIPKIPPSLPILFLSGRSDAVVPPVHMDHLWKVAEERGRPRGKVNLGNLAFKAGGTSSSGKEGEWMMPVKDKFVGYLKGGHADTCICPGYWDEVEAFIDQSVSI